MQFLAIMRPKPSATPQQIVPLLKSESAHAWELTATGVLRSVHYIKGPAGPVGAVVLLEAADESEGELPRAARASLAELPGQGVDEELGAMLGRSEGRRLLILIDLVGRRGIASAVTALVRLGKELAARTPGMVKMPPRLGSSSWTRCISSPPTRPPIP